jgi:23S rRNA (uridine2552-2'-O)-methyltransferase
MSRLHDKRHRHDVFHKRARDAGFAARSVFKLEEIDARHRVIPPRARVLDLGCRPGSWLQYAARVAGVDARLVGLDRTPLDVAIPGARILVGDVFAVSIEELRGDLEAFDVVLSEMAPDTSGVRSLDQARSETLFERALEIAEATLAPGGRFVGKLFQGPAFRELVARCRGGFERVAMVKPKSSRRDSIEQYVVAIGRR